MISLRRPDRRSTTLSDDEREFLANEGRCHVAAIRRPSSAIGSFAKRSDTDLNVIILIRWSEAQTNTKVRALVLGFRVDYRAALIRAVTQ